MAATGVMAVLALAAPFLVPLSRFIPELEQAASRALGQRVAMGSLALHVVPWPRIVAKDVRVGRRGAAKIERLEIVPDVLSFLSGRRELRRIRAEGVRLREAALGIPAAMPGAGSGEPLVVRRVELLRVKLEHAALALPELDLALELGPGAGLRRARLFSRDGGLALDIRPRREGTSRVVVGVEGELYGGTVRASTRVGWTRGWQVSGTVELGGVDLVPLQRAMGRPPRLSGRLHGEASFSAQAAAAGELADALVLSGPFEIVDGAYQGVDLSEVRNLPVGDLGRGGATPFKELRGVLQLRGRHVRIEALCVRSPILTAAGEVDIAPDDRLSGRLRVSVAKTGGFVGVPVALSGDTSNPSVSLTTAAKIGAVIGTVLLPGLGTALGVTAGGKLGSKVRCR